MELNASLTAEKTVSVVILIPAATCTCFCWTRRTCTCIYFQTYLVLEALTKRELLEVEVSMSQCLGHSRESILWNKSEVNLCGFSWQIHSMRVEDFDVKFALEFKECNNLNSQWWLKANTRGLRKAKCMGTVHTSKIREYLYQGQH